MKFSQFLKPTTTSDPRLTKTLENLRKDAFEEYRLVATPPDLKMFAILCNHKRKNDTKRLIWISDLAFVIWYASGFPPDLAQLSLAVGLQFHDGPTNYCSVHSNAVKNLIAGLERLFGLPDAFFTRLQIFDRNSFVFRNRVIEKLLLQNPKRETVFERMRFGEAESRILAAFGTRTRLTFKDCEDWYDKGLTFAAASASKNDNEAGPAQLMFQGRLLVGSYDEGVYLARMMGTRNLHSLVLDTVNLESLEGCGALARCNLPRLEIRGCEFADGGAALIDCIRNERGPKTLVIGHPHAYFYCRPFDSDERFSAFFNAIRFDTWLERLEIYFSVFYSRKGIMKTLASAIAENEFLQHLKLGWRPRCGFDEEWNEDGWEGWNELMTALAGQKSIQTLDLVSMETSTATAIISGRIMEVACMLNENKQIDRILLHDDSKLNCDLWRDLVIPKLERNKYRKLISLVQKIKSPSTRAAVMAKALAGSRASQVITWMLLSQNCAVLSNHQS